MVQSNPWINMADKPKIKPLINRVNTPLSKPKEIKFRGAAKTSKTGCNMAFKIPKTTAAIKAFWKLSIFTPVGSLEMIKNATALTNRDTIMANIFIFFNITNVLQPVG